MNCREFQLWLEERDLSDLSEADRAMKHQHACERCRELAKMDELLEATLAGALAPEPLPDHLQRIIELNLSSPSGGRKRSTAAIRAFSFLAGIFLVALVFVLLSIDYSGRDGFSSALATDHDDHHTGHAFERVDNLDLWLQAKSGGISLPAEFRRGDYILLGARICLVEKCRLAHLLFRQNDRVISLYLVEARQVPATLEEAEIYTLKQGAYQVRMWQSGQQVAALVSPAFH